ncbi:hypothetical protein BDQ17DRAFT_1310135 [Cyathus striatus]|nr:hypothetical protein BDQ17DRAFT_1310135 [Cyathus striatus]
MSESNTLFLLGATGFLGSQFLIHLSKSDLTKFHIRALLRAPIEKKEAQIKAIYPNLSVVEGTLEDDAIIQEEASKADYVINCASSDHHTSVVSTLAGLEKRSKAKPGNPPIYIHISGQGIVSDNSRGEFVELEKVPKYSDVGLDLDQCPSINMHLESDKLIVEYGTRKETPIRTLIVNPAWIYGVGEGVQKTTMPVRIFLDMFKKAGHAGTWGPGFSRMGNIHVKDCADAILVVFKAALEGKADEGKEGIYFVSSDQPMLFNNQITGKMGDVMFSKGLIPVGGTRPLPNEVVDPLGHYGWSLMGSNLIGIPHRLKKFGWEAKESQKITVLESLPDEIEAALKNQLI